MSSVRSSNDMQVPVHPRGSLDNMTSAHGRYHGVNMMGGISESRDEEDALDNIPLPPTSMSMTSMHSHNSHHNFHQHQNNHNFQGGQQQQSGGVVHGGVHKMPTTIQEGPDDVDE